MAPAPTQDLVAKVQRLREVASLRHDSVPDVAAALEEISQFLQEHETPLMNHCTHTVFDNYQDWWTGQQCTFKLAIAEDNTLDTLYRHISTLYDLGIPLTLAEKRSPQIRLVQDVEILGSESATLDAGDLLGPDRPFARLLGETLGELFPGSDFLDACVFNATGRSRTYGVMKTSLRIVWPTIVVDKERALRVRDYVVHRFHKSQDERIGALRGEMQALNTENNWGNVFSDSIYSGRFGLRMPLCDRVSPSPLKRPEHRPFRPFAVVRFHFATGALDWCEKIAGPEELSGCQWLKIGTCRRDAGTPLTEWVAPTCKAAMPSATTAAAACSPVVAVRSRGGSDGPGRPARRKGAAAAGGRGDTVERVARVEREFDGTARDFGARLEQHLGGSQQGLVVQEGQVLWTGDAGARIEFRESNRRVFIVGQPHQIQRLLAVIQPFAQAVGDYARSVTHIAASNGTGGRRASAPSQVYAPSVVYQPSAVYAPSVAYAAYRSISVPNGDAE